MITRPALSQRSLWWIDVGVVALLAALLYGFTQTARHWEAPFEPQTEISLSLWALPVYTLFSLLRGFVAYGISFLFTLIYGYWAAHHARAERVMVPLLDVLQSIPVLGFLPSVVLALIALFPSTNAGLELASILMIFTGQVWNMTFSFYHSLRAIPAQLKEASSVYQFNWWQRFRRVELPAAGVGLAWNSMMAMAGGWFFLMICEAFTLGDQHFRLPGLGAYMSVAIAQHNPAAMAAGIVAMVAMIIAVDACVWRPVIVWAQRFRLDETGAGLAQESAVLNWLRRSALIHQAMVRMVHPVSEWLATRPSAPEPVAVGTERPRWRPAHLLGAALGVAVLLSLLWAGSRLGHLLFSLGWRDWVHIGGVACLTFLRVMGAVVLGSCWTIPLGVWIGCSDRRCARLQPLVQIAASFPVPMLYPLILLALRQVGISLGWSAVVLMLLGTQWYILFNVIAGASAVPADLREVARAYQFTPAQRWRRLWWPAVFPYLVTGWITAAGGAWNASIVAECIAVGPQTFVAYGLGSLISVAAGRGQYQLLAAGVLTMALVVVLVNRFVWKPLYRFAETRYAY